MTDDVREQGLRVLQELVPHLSADSVEPDGTFGDELLAIGVDNVFGRLWSRDGLSRRDRSLVTMGILIALRATDEFESHVKIGLRNGLTEDEIAEVIYHASGYAGFPAANTARNVARKALSDK
jgi:4-carboxymuconolactone decarboxylase